MQARNYPIHDRWSWLWLLLGAGLSLFTYGDWLLPLLVWVVPIFSLRFMRSQPTWRGFLLLVLAMIPMLSIMLRGVVPIPGPAYAVFVVITAFMAGLPYLLDRLLAPRLPAFAAALVLPLAVTSLEFVNAQGQWGTWGASAYTLAGNLPLLQLVSLTGLWGLVFLVNWFAAMVNLAWEANWRWPQIRLPLLSYAALLALALTWGAARSLFISPTETVRVAGIPSAVPFMNADEGTIAQLDRVLPGTADPVERRELREFFAANNDGLLERSVTEARAGAEIVFWAEGNAALLKEDEADLIARGKELAEREGIYLGMAMAVFTPGAEQPLENKVVLLTSQGEIGFEYLKAFPVPGSEAAGSVAGVAEMLVLDTPHGRIASVICFDMDHHSFIRQAAQKDVDILFAPANTWPEIAELHAEMAGFRALENGVSVVRVASNGVSVAYDALGNPLARSNYWQSEAGTLVAQVPTQRQPTLYGLIGDSFAYLALGALATLSLWGIFRGRRTASRAVQQPAA